MSKCEGTILVVVQLPSPWPPPIATSILHRTEGDYIVEIVAKENGKLALTISEKTGTVIAGLVSQTIDVKSCPCSAILGARWSGTKCELRINHNILLPDLPGIQPFSVWSSQAAIESGYSFNDPLAVPDCREWVNNRKLKFGGVRTPRQDRRLKSVEEEAEDLRNSIIRLQDLRQQTLAGKKYLLGTLAGEMRASVYWPKGRDKQPDDNWNPLLLRMANKAELPLPVYYSTPKLDPAIGSEPDWSISAEAAPRVQREFPNDKICDLQEALLSDVMWVGPPPSRTISTIELIKELAHTMGAAHYDIDASGFVELLRNISAFHRDHVTILICQTADALISLSEWVISELKIRKVIG